MSLCGKQARFKPNQTLPVTLIPQQQPLKAAAHCSSPPSYLVPRPKTAEPRLVLLQHAERDRRVGRQLEFTGETTGARG